MSNSFVKSFKVPRLFVTLTVGKYTVIYKSGYMYLKKNIK